MLYSITSKDSAILVSIQAKPQDKSIDLEKFYKQKLAQTERKQTPLGTATIGNLGNSVFVSLITDKSWIILTADKQSDQTKDRLISVLGSMHSN